MPHPESGSLNKSVSEQHRPTMFRPSLKDGTEMSSSTQRSTTLSQLSKGMLSRTAFVLALPLLQETPSLIRFGYFMSRVFSTSLAESVHHRSSFLSWRGHSSDTLLIPLTYNSTHPRYRLAFHLETVLREASILISIYLPKSLFYSYLYFPS
ncbi:hypothetical protein HZ326_10858 [Fusarium oxysporum f. sp. albedinis]|nr:hypothetical protein HZ326_10858 [Fusarium oxysporum f. sp. albedinis]